MDSMYSYFSLLALLALAQALVCLILFSSAVSWIVKHPGGADPGERFPGLLSVASMLGIMVSALLLTVLAPLVFSQVSSAGLGRNELYAIGLCLLTLGPALPALALLKGRAKKANLVALLNGASLVCIGLIALFLVQAIRNL